MTASLLTGNCSIIYVMITLVEKIEVLDFLQWLEGEVAGIILLEIVDAK